jgi:hypothetical protein
LSDWHLRARILDYFEVRQASEATSRRDGRIINERTRPYAEHSSPARHIIELHQPPGHREGVVVWQRDDARAQTDVARALCGGGNEHLGASDDLKSALSDARRSRPRDS